MLAQCDKDGKQRKFVYTVLATGHECVVMKIAYLEIEKQSCKTKCLLLLPPGKKPTMPTIGFKLLATLLQAPLYDLGQRELALDSIKLGDRVYTLCQQLGARRFSHVFTAKQGSKEVVVKLQPPEDKQFTNESALLQHL